MRSCIIDNSTLTAIDRLLGHIPVGNYHQIAGDIAAFENFIQAILFYDKLSFLDDYKEEFKQGRRSRYPFVHPITATAPEYSISESIARNTIQKMTPAIQESRFSDADFAPFIEMLKANLVFSWRFHSSVYWLTISLLTRKYGKEAHKYSKVWQAILSQLHEMEKSPQEQQKLKSLILHERDGTTRDISSLRNREGVYGSLEAFLSSLSWLAFRTTFYSVMAELLSMDAVLHPIRHAFRLNVLHRHMGLGVDAYSSVLAAMNDRIKATTTEILHATQPVITRIELPYFSAYLLQKTGDVRKVIDAALELRQDKRFRDARNMFVEMEDTEDKKTYVKKVNKVIRDLDKTAQLLRSEFGIAGKQGIQTGPVITVANVALNLALPDVDLRLPIPESIMSLFGRRNFQGIFRSVVEDLSSIEKLGSLRTKFAAAANKSTAERSMIPTESPHWFGINSGVCLWQ